jgi:predicted outer membrane protein
MKTHLTVIGFFSLLLFTATGCYSEHYDEHPIATAISLNPNEAGLQDSLFIRDAILESSRQVEVARVGVEQAHNLDLKLLAQRIVDERANAVADLRIIARQQHVPSAPEPNHSNDVAFALSNLSGDKFDQMYVRFLLQSHRDQIHKYRAGARNLRNSDVRDFAGRDLPFVQEYFRIAENINTMAGMKIEVNEPAGAEREGRDPFYQGDQSLPQLYTE